MFGGKGIKIMKNQPKVLNILKYIENKAVGDAFEDVQ